VIDVTECGERGVEALVVLGSAFLPLIKQSNEQLKRPTVVPEMQKSGYLPPFSDLPLNMTASTVQTVSLTPVSSLF